MILKRFERALLAGCLSAGTLFAVSGATAQEGGDTSVGTSTTASAAAGPTTSEISSGLAAFDRGDFENAAVQFWDALTGMTPDDPSYARAQYELARSLVRLELYQSSVLFFDEILLTGPSHPYFEAAVPWLVTIARAVPGDAGMLQRLSEFAPIYPQGVEPRYQSELAFLMARHFYDVGELEQTQDYLGQVDESSEFYPNALFLSAITYVRQYEARPASERLNALRAYLEDAPRNDESLQTLRDLVDITMARTFYSAGQYEDSLRYYSRVEQRDRYWLDALFESSWAYFQLDQYNRALGNLHSLNSPFFNDQYYPEAPILQSVIQFYNCRFREVRSTLEEFNYVYVPLREELEFQLISMGSAEDVYSFISEGGATETGEFDPRLQQILNATLSEKRLRESVDFVGELDDEIARLGSRNISFQQSAVGQFLSTQLGRLRSEAVRSAGELGEERLNAVLDELRDRERAASALLVETDLAEANALSEDLADELAGAGSEEVGEIEVPADYIRWPFEGEYWRDELGHYYYRIASRCQLADE